MLVWLLAYSLIDIVFVLPFRFWHTCIVAVRRVTGRVRRTTDWTRVRLPVWLTWSRWSAEEESARWPDDARRSSTWTRATARRRAARAAAAAAAPCGGRCPSTGSDLPEAEAPAETSTAWFTCRPPWMCPTAAALIIVRRRLELNDETDETTFNSPSVTYSYKAVVTTTIRLRLDRRSTPVRLRYDHSTTFVTTVGTAA